MIKIEKFGVPYNKGKIDLLESKIKKKLPKDYKEFLQNYNGGEPEECIGHLQDSEIEDYGIQDFFGTDLDSYNDLIEVYNNYKDILPNNCLVIAEVIGGDKICLSVEENNYGTIWYWNHEEHEDKVELTDLYYVSKTFISFLEELQKETE